MNAPSKASYDAVVLGSGPNGLAAAIFLAQQGLSVLIVEAAAKVGGGLRSEALTLEGFTHDVCSAIHPLAVHSPFLTGLPLADYGLKWVYSPYAFAHPLDDEPAAFATTSLKETAASLGKDAVSYERLFAPVVKNFEVLLPEILGPLLHWPKHKASLMHFGARALWPSTLLAKTLFREEQARALFAGLAAHSILPLNALATSAIALVLGAAGHVKGWPFPQGGAQRLADALKAYFLDLGGELVTDCRIDRLADLPKSRATLLDISPKQFLQMSPALPKPYRFWLKRYVYGAGVFKIDYALKAPIPWLDPACAKAATVHLGGGLEELSRSEASLYKGRVAQKPFVLLAQQSLFDLTRAPEGYHTCWAYCHVPAGSKEDMSQKIEDQIERFAPGFKKTIIARSQRTVEDYERYNPNYIGGDINGGKANLWQLFARPVPSIKPYKTPLKGVYLCSASTPPGGGVHGMCGYHAAKSALEDVFVKP